MVECREKHSGLLFEDGRDDPFSDRGSLVSKGGTFSESCSHKLVNSIHVTLLSSSSSSSNGSSTCLQMEGLFFVFLELNLYSMLALSTVW